jgi:hypothetical protein
MQATNVSDGQQIQEAAPAHFHESQSTQSNGFSQMSYGKLFIPIFMNVD